jgi:hypothetical protein
MQRFVIGRGVVPETGVSGIRHHVYLGTADASHLLDGFDPLPKLV